MARMLKLQMDHALERLNEIRGEAIGDAPDARDARLRFRAELISSGQVKIDDRLVASALKEFDRAINKKVGRYGRHQPVEEYLSSAIEKAIDIQYASKKGKALEKKHLAAFNAWEARVNAINAEYQRIKDELILGDVEVAMQLIEAFRNFKG